MARVVDEVKAGTAVGVGHVSDDDEIFGCTPYQNSEDSEPVGLDNPLRHLPAVTHHRSKAHRRRRHPRARPTHQDAPHNRKGSECAWHPEPIHLLRSALRKATVLDEGVVGVPARDRNLALLFELTHLLHNPQLHLFHLAQTHGTKKLHLLRDKCAHTL